MAKKKKPKMLNNNRDAFQVSHDMLNHMIKMSGDKPVKKKRSIKKSK